MNINASIIDQRVSKVKEEIKDKVADEFGIKDEDKLVSFAFLFLCVKTTLDLDNSADYLDHIVEGGGDMGIDAVYISPEADGEFVVTLFQSKYKRSLDADSNFPENGVEKLISSLGLIFNPSATLTSLSNKKLLTKIEEIRSLIRDGFLPQVNIVCCNNGKKWNDSAEQRIFNANLGSQVSWTYFNHDSIVKILNSTSQIDANLKLQGNAIIEDMDYSRVCVGRMSLLEVHQLIKAHGERLLERNIRRYLGTHGNRVNESIKKTLESKSAKNFYFLNNGITFICNDFTYNALQKSDFMLKVEGLQIINGGQTCMTIFKTIEASGMSIQGNVQNSSVLVRVYKLPSDEEGIASEITYATNSQNPVDLKDLHSNDEKQKQLELSIQELGFNYRTKKSSEPLRPSDITSGVAAEAILATWRGSPQRAKFFTREHFGKLYNQIFSDDLNGAQLVIAVLVYRICENRRKRPLKKDPDFVRYASCFMAMLIGKKVLAGAGLKGLKDLDHRNFNIAKEVIEDQGEVFLDGAIAEIEFALGEIYKAPPNLQQLAATFRGGMLLDVITNKLLSSNKGDGSGGG